MFIHKILPAIPGFELIVRHGELLTFVVTLGVSYVIALILPGYSIPRALLLGSQADFGLLAGSLRSIPSTG
jgi:hypothetical protein